jgi:hypothetical protein
MKVRTRSNLRYKGDIRRLNLGRREVSIENISATEFEMTRAVYVGQANSAATQTPHCKLR